VGGDAVHGVWEGVLSVVVAEFTLVVGGVVTLVSRGAVEGEVDKVGITGALLERNIVGLVVERTMLSSGGVELSCRTFTGSLSSSNANSCSKSIFQKVVIYRKE
jgi:hypothetical protein